MKPITSAKIEERALSGGQVQLYIEHDVLRGVTPEMLVWWWRNIEGEMELGGRKYTRYLIWHPIDHIHFTVHERRPDGSVGPGSVFHIVEALGADMNNLVDVRAHLRRIDERGAMIEVLGLGQPILRIEGHFVPAEQGTMMISTMTIGSAGWIARNGLNQLLIDWLFPPVRRQAWLKHSVEEIGNLQFFLPALFRSYVS
jgi:hypothetical protein